MAREIKVTSALGDYVHLTAKGYQEHGTLRPWNERSNYNIDVFTKFQNNIYERAKRLAFSNDINALKKAQDQYNQNRKEKYEILKNLFESSQATDKAFAQQFAKALALTANLPNIDEKILAEMLQFDDAIGNATAKNVTLTKGMLTESSQFSSMTEFGGSQYGRLSTFQNRLELLKRQIDMAEKDSRTQMNTKDIEALNVARKELLNLEGLMKKILQLQEKNEINLNFGNNIEMDKELQDYDSNLQTHLRRNSTSKQIELSVPLSKFLSQSLMNIQKKIRTTDILTKIMAAFTEIMGALSSDTAENLTEKSILQIIDDSVKGTSSGKVRIKAFAEAKKVQQRFNLTKDIFNLNVSNNLAAGKVDAVLTINEEKIAASMKNYNLGAEQYFNPRTQQLTTKHISLVSGTPLTSLLLTAETYQKNLGTHFLNILTEKEDQLIESRRVGMHALEIFTIYMALTGGSGNLSLKSNQGANLIIVEDKASKIAKFFSINSILAMAATDMQNFSIKANKGNLTDLVIPNSRIDIHDNITQNINTRLANVLKEAHAAKISVGVSIPSINTLVRSRGF